MPFDGQYVNQVCKRLNKNPYLWNPPVGKIVVQIGKNMPTGKDTPATAVERALGILEVVSQRSDGLTNSEISRKLGIPKSTASYILRCLERRRYLHRDAGDGKYRLGLKILDLGHG